MRAATVAALVVVVLLLTGCGGNRMTPEEIAEIAAARDACNAADGTFVHFQSGLSGAEMWRCDFDQREDD